MKNVLKSLTAVCAALFLSACEHEADHAPTPPPIDQQPQPNPPRVSYTKPAGQIVHIAFDGSSNLRVWQDTLDFALQHDVKFTFFIVGVHLLNDDLATLYDPPRRRPGRSDVGFGGTRQDVEQRLSMLRRAYREGHEIAGHANGHWDGSNFTYEEWTAELSQFKSFCHRPTF